METLKDYETRLIRIEGYRMKRIVCLLVLFVLVLSVSSVSTVAGAAELIPGSGYDPTAYIRIGDYGDEVVALHEKLGELGYYSLRPESPWSVWSVKALKVLQENLSLDTTGIVADKEAYDAIMNIENESVIGKNYAVGTSDQWSEWFTPEYDAENRCFTVAYAILDNKAVGDYYTCSVEIEVRDVAVTEGQQFRFVTQGAVDGTWDKGNVWNENIFYMQEAPENGVYLYTATNRISEKNVECLKFDLGFRCDYWKSGSFRVKNVKVEKGMKVTEWCSAE